MMISTQFSYVMQNKRFYCIKIWKKTNEAIFHLLNNLVWWFANNITLFTEVSEPADPNLSVVYPKLGRPSLTIQA